MSQPWWVLGSSVSPTPKWALGDGSVPVLLRSDRASVIAEINSRIAAYTQEWSALGTDDAGVALVTLFGGLMEPVLTRLDKLPQKAFVEALRIIGIEPLPAEAASAMLEFTILNSATGSVLIPEGFQVGARPPAGSGNLIILETQDNLYATAAQIVQMQVQEGSLFRDITPDPNSPAPFAPFGAAAQAGAALYLGLSGPAPQIRMSIGIDVVTPAGIPAPVAMGGVMPLPPVGPTATLIWEAYDGGSGAFQTAAIVSDSTGGLVQSGVVVLTVPPIWTTGTPPGLDACAGPPVATVENRPGAIRSAPHAGGPALEHGSGVGRPDGGRRGSGFQLRPVAAPGDAEPDPRAERFLDPDCPRRPALPHR